MSPNSRSSGVVFSSHFGMPEAESGSARIEHIGDKAAGLLRRLPEAWTLPFFVLPTTVHDALLPKDGSSPITDPQIVFSGLRRELVTWLSVITEKGRYGLIFRSSAAGETLAERGRYLSLAKKPKQNYGEFCRSVLDIVEQAATQSPGVRTAVIVQRYLRMDIPCEGGREELSGVLGGSFNFASNSATRAVSAATFAISSALTANAASNWVRGRGRDSFDANTGSLGGRIFLR